MSFAIRGCHQWRPYAVTGRFVGPFEFALFEFALANHFGID
jgi:hypothetical protein